MKHPKDKNRIPTDGRPTTWTEPFAALKSLKPLATPANPASPETGAPSTPAPKQKRGRVDIIRQTAHRGGKTVTVIANFTGVDEAEKIRLARMMQKACGAGGTVKNGQIEIHGDQRDAVARLLTEAGFRPVFSGG